MDFAVGDKITLKKTHPCGSDVWKILRTGADMKLECAKCGRTVMMDYAEFCKSVKAPKKGK